MLANTEVFENKFKKKLCGQARSKLMTENVGIKFISTVTSLTIPTKPNPNLNLKPELNVLILLVE